MTLFEGGSCSTRFRQERNKAATLCRGSIPHHRKEDGKCEVEKGKGKVTERLALYASVYGGEQQKVWRKEVSFYAYDNRKSRAGSTIEFHFGE